MMKAFDYEYDREALVRRRKKRRIAVVLWGCALALLCALGLILVWMTGIHHDVCGPAACEAVNALREGECILLGNLRYLCEEISGFEKEVKLQPLSLIHIWCRQ